MSEKFKGEREPSFQRNQALEKLLGELNDALEPAESLLLDSALSQEEKKPPVFVFGPLRSGTTLFMQWLASTGSFAYPSNLLSRFYRAPLVGAMIQLMLTDSRYGFRDEMAGIEAQVNYESDNGKTRGILAPNEFWYFWRRFLPFADRDWATDEELHRRVDTDTLKKEVVGLGQLFQKPFAMKAMILNYNIPFLASVFPEAIFIQLRRDPVTNVASVLEARRRQYGREDVWYSFKIPEYETLAEMPPLPQCAGQIHFNNLAISKAMQKIEECRRMVVDYENFCERPEHYYDQLAAKLTENDLPRYTGRSSFSHARSVTTDRKLEIEQALASFSS